MREIKFRAWDSKIMYEPFDMDYALKSIKGELSPPARFSEENIFMQYTGLKDKNGKEIYEGDVVKNNIGTIGIIEDITRDISYYDLRDETMEHEVIGNIYETPELIKSKQTI